MIALTGGSGFLGSRVVAAVGNHVSLDRGEPDLADPRRLARRLDGVTAVVHLAAAYRRFHKPEDVGVLVDSNIRLGALLLEACGLAGVPRIVVADTPFGQGVGANLYGATRRAFGALLDWYEASGDLVVVRLVVHDLYGPDDPRPKLLPALLRARTTGQPAHVVDDGPAMDLLHVDDAVRGVLHALDVPGGTYALRSGECVTPRGLVARLQAVGGPVPTVAASAEIAVGPSVWSGPELPGWQATISLDQGLAALCSRG